MKKKKYNNLGKNWTPLKKTVLDPLKKKTFKRQDRKKKKNPTLTQLLHPLQIKILERKKKLIRHPPPKKNSFRELTDKMSNWG